MYFRDLETQLKQRFFPVFFVYGEDAYLCENAVRRITSTLNISLPEMNIQRYFADNALMESIINSCNTTPFASQKKLIIVNGYPTGLRSVSSQALLKAKERLTQYASNPNNDCCLIFVATADNDFFKIDGIEKVICNKQERGTLINWIMVKVSKSKRTITQQTAGLLADYCLRDMSRISLETEKLLSLTETGEITMQMVDQLVYQDMEYVVFDFLDSVAEKNSQKALVILDRMLESGEKPKELFRLLYGSYRRMFYCSIYKGETPEMAKMLRTKEYPITKAKAIGKKYSPTRLKQALDMFADLDARTNSVRITADDLSVLVLQLLNI